MIIFIEQKMASEINIEEIIDELKILMLIKRRLEIQMLFAINIQV